MNQQANRAAVLRELDAKIEQAAKVLKKIAAKWRNITEQQRKTVGEPYLALWIETKRQLEEWRAEAETGDEQAVLQIAAKLQNLQAEKR